MTALQLSSRRDMCVVCLSKAVQVEYQWGGMVGWIRACMNSVEQIDTASRRLRIFCHVLYCTLGAGTSVSTPWKIHATRLG
jgi:hypothetical protein